LGSLSLYSTVREKQVLLLSEQQRDVHKGTKGSRANLLLKGCYMKESTIVITKHFVFLLLGRSHFDWAISKKIIGTLDVPQDHEAFGVVKVLCKKVSFFCTIWVHSKRETLANALFWS